MVFFTNSQVSTSVQEGVGNEGHSGNINITTSGVYTFPPESASTIDASSKLGIDAGRLMEKPCEARTYQERKNRDHFVVHPLAGSPASPYDLQPSPLPKTTTTKQRQQTSPKNNDSSTSFNGHDYM